MRSITHNQSQIRVSQFSSPNYKQMSNRRGKLPLHPTSFYMVNFDQHDLRDDFSSFLIKNLFRIQIVLISHCRGLIDQVARAVPSKRLRTLFFADSIFPEVNGQVCHPPLKS
jgi:hypothetical protein